MTEFCFFRKVFLNACKRYFTENGNFRHIVISKGVNILKIYRWFPEVFPVKPRCCMADKWCDLTSCPAWYSRGDGTGRCVMVPGVDLDEISETQPRT